MKFEKVKIKGKEYPIAFTVLALAEFSEEYNIDLTQLGDLSKVLTLKKALKLIYYGLQEGYRLAGKTFDLSFENACDLIGNDFEVIGKAFEVFQQQMPQPEPAKNVKAATPKK